MTTPADLRSFAVDSADIFYITGVTVYRLPQSGGPPTAFQSAPAPGPINVELDATHVYWDEGGLPQTLRRAPRAGGSPEVLVQKNAAWTTDYSLAVASTRVYWHHGDAVTAFEKAGACVADWPSVVNMHLAPTPNESEVFGVHDIGTQGRVSVFRPGPASMRTEVGTIPGLNLYPDRDADIDDTHLYFNSAVGISRVPY